MTERQKMISGQLYKSGVKELANDRMCYVIWKVLERSRK